MNLAELDAHRHTVSTSAGPVSYLDVGAGPTTLFVHGVGTSALFWHRAITALADERRCVALDLPLHGSTPAAPDQDFTIGGLAEVVEAFCAAAGIEVADVVAHDTGGGVAQVFAARHAQRLRSLCLTNCDTHDNVPPEAFQPTIDLAATGQLAPAAPALMADMTAARDAVFAMGYEHPETLDLDLVRRFLEPLMGTEERARMFEQLLVSLRPDDLLAAEGALGWLMVPTLILWGNADDFFATKWAYWLQELIPGATEVIEVEGGRLFFPDERADELVTALRNHWSGVASGAIS